MKLFDPKKKQLICIEEKASKVFWESHWNLNEDIVENIINTKDTFVSRITKKYIKDKNEPILEGGSGDGTNVASLVNNGYKCIGVDYAGKTVKKINQYIPELDIREGDVKNLKFKKDYFFGYWSIGVIEHYWEGFESIASEMKRVINKNGYLFLSFPYLSPIRRLKICLGLYEVYKSNKQPKNFYQLILNSKSVIKYFQDIGFKLIKSVPFDGIKGTKDEILIIKPLLQKIYDYNGNKRLPVILRKIIDLLLFRFCAHCVLLVFKKL